jgi:hypothetical protein
VVMPALWEPFGVPSGPLTELNGPPADAAQPEHR